ncbi:Rrf2 family transcriptional regulator [Candidatus Cyanaurora vandensis]|uniref:RrF2 family transcriptional regulator n=1 Tax=Candidatus Cyanaurora vandensis TaxID=2714958 RepID=UPI002580BBAE|nr:Rrf2 family transcriptional regulator [Candidatus Cyanaurora vandensis]
MFQLCSKSEYALLALIELALVYESNEPLQIREIASRQHIPDRYLEQLLANLRREGLVRSQRGAKGGYLLARAPWQVSMWDVCQAIQGEDNPEAEVPSPTLELTVVREGWQKAGAAAEKVLRTITLKDLLETRASQQTPLMYYI